MKENRMALNPQKVANDIHCMFEGAFERGDGEPSQRRVYAWRIETVSDETLGIPRGPPGSYSWKCDRLASRDH